VTGILPFCPFPPLHWWALARQGALIDAGATFQKQSLQNRMVIAGPQGKQRITFPVQHAEVEGELLLSDHLLPTQSWRSLKTAYGGSPFFEFFEDELQALWSAHLPKKDEHTKTLHAWCEASILWVCATCGWAIPATADAAPAMGLVSHDLRFKKALSGEGWTFHRYAQVFEQQQGFIPGCAILDALFVLGPQELSHRFDDLVTPPRT
jgi:hypothetical protein